MEEDPNAAVTCSSPPCFMHELDPSYLGYLRREEVVTLLAAVLAAEWGGAAPDEAQLRVVLGRHLEALGATSREKAVSGGPDRLAPAIRDALPRLYDHALRHDLEAVLGALERGIPHRDGVQDKG